MRVKKTSDTLPDWVIENKKIDNLTTKKETEINSIVKASKIKLLENESLNESKMVAEREKIEKTMSNEGKYYCDSGWGEEAQKQLKEYASACGMNKKDFVVISNKDIKEVSKEIPKREVKKSSIPIGDAFKLDRFDDIEKQEPNWEKIEKSKSLVEKPSLLSNSVVAVRGGEDYNKNTHRKKIRGQNSIMEEDAIGEYAKNGEDSGEYFSKMRAKLIEEKQSKRKEWEKDAVDSLPKIRGRSSIFPIESAQDGAGKNKKALTEDFTIKQDDIKGLGDTLKGRNQNRKEAIKNKKEKDDSWQEVKKPDGTKISDVFGEELKKFMGK